MYCCRCGKECRDDAEFCSYCGTKLKDGAVVTAKNRESANSAVGFAGWLQNKWDDLGHNAVKIVFIAVALFVCLLTWKGELLTLTVSVWSYEQQFEITGLDLIGGSGLLSMVINLLYLSAVAFIIYPLAFNHTFTTNNFLPAKIAGYGTIGLLIYGAIDGYSEGYSLLDEYGLTEAVGKLLQFSITEKGWVLILSLILMLVLVGMVTRDEEMFKRVATAKAARTVSYEFKGEWFEGQVTKIERYIHTPPNIEWVFLKQKNGTVQQLSHDVTDNNEITKGIECRVYVKNRKILDFRPKSRNDT